jgi:hypothetical protein
VRMRSSGTDREIPDPAQSRKAHSRRSAGAVDVHKDGIMQFFSTA